MSAQPDSADIELALTSDDVDSAFEEEPQEAPSTKQETERETSKSKSYDIKFGALYHTTDDLQQEDITLQTEPKPESAPTKEDPPPESNTATAKEEETKPEIEDAAQTNTEWSISKSVSIKFDLYYDADELADEDAANAKDPETDKTKNEEQKQLLNDEESEAKEVMNEQSIINNISIWLAFLLHDSSPLWDENVRHHSTKELLEEMRIKKHNNTLKDIEYNFDDRCSIFKSNYVLGVEPEETVSPQSPSTTLRQRTQITSQEHEQLLEKIMEPLNKLQMKRKWAQMIKYWDSWTDNRHVEVNEFLDLQRFDWDLNYTQKIETVTKDMDVLIDQLKDVATNKIKTKGNAEDLQRMEELRAVSNRKSMKKWLHTYKKKTADIEEEDEVTYLESLEHASSKLFKQIMGYDLDHDEDLKSTISMANLPLKRWRWQHVVFWVERLDEFKDFSSVFFEWKINGEELLAMSVDHIRWLTSCCYRAERVAKELVKDLIIEIKKEMIRSMVTYQYGIFYRTIRQKSTDISKLLEYLRPKKEQGPKALWKLDAFYFSKIDNMLAILTASELCRELFRDWNPKFIFDDEETHHNVLEVQEKERKQTIADAEAAQHKSSPKLTFKDKVHIESVEEKAEIAGDKEDETVTITEQKEARDIVTRPIYIDCIDKLANCCCLRDNCCGTYIRNFDRVYLKVITLYTFILSFGCLVVWFWMSSRSRLEVDISMRWTAESILARAIQYMEYEFFIPQMILNIAIGGLYSGDISTDFTQFWDNPQYDSFFAQYKSFAASESNIYALCMYETTNDSMFCAQNNPLGIYVFNGTCVHGWNYDYSTMQRNTTNFRANSCTYEPKTRPWYIRSQELEFDDVGWTEPYIFSSGAIGMSLVRRIMYNGVEVIWLAEFTTAELETIFAGIGSVDGGISYLVSNRGSVIASSLREYDLNLNVVNCEEDADITCSATNPLLLDSIAMLRADADEDNVLHVYSNNSVIERDDTVLTLTSFETTYLSGTNFEYGTIAVVYSDDHLSRIQTAEALTMGLYIFALALAVIISCTMATYIQQLQKQIKEDHDPTGRHIRYSEKSIDLDVIQEAQSTHIDRTETIPEHVRLNEARSEDKAYIASKYDSYLVRSDWIMDHRCLTISTFWYMMVVFLATFYIWQSKVDDTLDDITETFLTEEYMIVTDKVSNVVILAESIADIVVDRFNRGDMAVKDTSTIDVGLDVFFANIMNSFKQPNGNFYAHMLYIGMPDGKFIGSKRETSDENKEKFGHTLRIAVRDNSTDWHYTQFAADPETLQRTNISTPLFDTELYDPRCRSWFKATVSYTVDSDIWSAFGGGSNFLDFYNEDTLDARFSTGCVDVMEYYMDLWNVTADELKDINDNNGSIPADGSISLDMNEFYAAKVAAKGIRYEMTWSQYLFASGSLGLTATKPILNDTTGELLAVMAIDFTLEGLSDYLNSTNNDAIGEDPWYAWIFTGDAQHELIASSDHNITRPADEIEGCIQLAAADADELVQWQASEHPNFFVRVISQEIIQFYPNMNDLPINTTTVPQQIRLPVDLPDALSGRFLTYPYSNESAEVSLNWIVTKSIDITNFETKENDDVKIVGFLLCVLLFTVHMIQANMSKSTVKENELRGVGDDADDIVSQHVSSANLSRTGTMEATEAQKESQQRAQNKYGELLYEMVNIVEGSSAEIWDVFLQSFEETIGDYPISTSIVRDFMAKESNKHIKTDENDDLTLALCALEVEKQWMAFTALKYIRSGVWNSFVTTVIFLHLICGLYLPATQNDFRNEGFSDGQSTGALVATCLFVIVEIIDVILQFIARFIHFGVIKRDNLECLFKLKYRSNHPYVQQVVSKSNLWLVFWGSSDWKLFQIHIFIVGLIVTNLILMVSLNFAPFEYFLPIVPLFLAVRSEDIRNFSYQFFYAVYLAKDVLFSYFILILIVAILALSVFKDILNPYSSTDTYSSSIRAIITSFVFVSTGENYNEIVYSAIDREGAANGSNFWFNTVESSQTISIINLLFFVVISIIGLYFFIPVMIHKFELAFKNSAQRINDKTLATKINNIIAAFIMIDMNDDGEISVDEFQHLVHSSIISRDVLFDAFANASGDEDDKISLFEFTSTLTNRTQFSVAIIGLKCEVWRIQAYLETNWYRRKKNRYYLLVYLMVPAFFAAILRGLGGIDKNFLNVLVHCFFIINFADVNLRCFAYGFKRYFNLVGYENPPLIQQAIYNWRVERAIANIDDMDAGDFGHVTIRLSYDSKKWCANNLRPIKPFSAWQKMTISTVHKFEFYLIWFASCGIILGLIFPASLKGYHYLFVQFYMFRLFTLIEANQRLVVLIFTIIPKFLNLLSFLFIFIFIWARIGCTVFAGKTAYVLNDIYDTGTSANFDTLGSSILTLMQLMVGEGWHEVMYLNMIATRIEYSAYFIFYIGIVTLIITNIFVGLFLSEIEGLDNKQSESDLVNQWMESHYNFKQIAHKRRNQLMKKLKDVQFHQRDLQKQIEKIDQLVKNKTKKKKSKWRLVVDEDEFLSDDD